VEIDLNKVGNKVEDLSGGIKGKERSRMSNWAKKDKEVLIFQRVPAEAVKKID